MNTAQDILHSVFGYATFRPPQDRIIETVIEGGDALVLMPTGGGKSLCYQIPALARTGCGVVISPLIALMQDQVSALRLLGVKANFLNSTLDPATAQEIEQDLLAGRPGPALHRARATDPGAHPAVIGASAHQLVCYR